MTFFTPANLRGWGPHGQAGTITLVTEPRSGAHFWVRHELAPIIEGFVTELGNLYLMHPDQCGGYNDRLIAGTQTWSNHAWGLAIDIDWLLNPMTEDGIDHDALPLATQGIANRWGLFWGADYSATGRRDPMHFEWLGTPADVYALLAMSGNPSPLLALGSVGNKVADVQRALDKCGNTIKVDGIFGPDTDRILRVFQSHRKLAPTGTTTLPTWAALRAVAHPQKG